MERTASVFLVAGILILFHVSLAAKMQSEAAVSALHHTIFPFGIEQSALPTQKQMFLEALLAFPHIQEVKTQVMMEESMDGIPVSGNRAEITLRSLADFDTVFAFLLRPELKGVLVQSDLLSLPSLRQSLEDRLLEGKQRGGFALFVAICSLLLLSLFLVLRIARQRILQEVRLLQLFGAGRWTVLSPFMREGMRILIPAFFLALLGTGIVLFTLGVAFPSRIIVLMLLFAEAIMLFVLLVLAASCVFGIHFRAGSA